MFYFEAHNQKVFVYLYMGSQFIAHANRNHVSGEGIADSGSWRVVQKDGNGEFFVIVFFVYDNFVYHGLQ